MSVNDNTKYPPALQAWLQTVLRSTNYQLAPLSGDASFRRYFRVLLEQKSFVVMDPGKDRPSCQAYVAISRALRKVGVLTPKIYAEDEDQGYLLLSDFGDQLYLPLLNNKTANALYQKAFESLLLMQDCSQVDHYQLPDYDQARYATECQLFGEWYLQKQLGLSLTRLENQLLDHIQQLLIEDAIRQPQTFVHRDYHSRNLLLTESKLAILDFQDAVKGPITYDLLSLLRDCYIDWPKQQVNTWVRHYLKMLNQRHAVVMADPEQFMQWFDWIGLQRNLKCVGIFARLNQRDQKPHYLNDIPRVLNYLSDVCDRYKEFTELKLFLTKRKVIQ